MELCLYERKEMGIICGLAAAILRSLHEQQGEYE